MNVEKISAFSFDNEGGNPAGVLISDEMLSDSKMLEIAKEVNYSETAFLVKENDSFRIRYFSPETEIPFCGHATIASGFVLGERFGLGKYNLILNDGTIDVDVEKKNGNAFATISSMETSSKEIDVNTLEKIIDTFNFGLDDLDEKYPVQIAFSGNNHLILFVKDKNTLENLSYDFDKNKKLVDEEEIVTISVLWAQSDTLIHSRNTFAFGGVEEDPATGSAAVALGEYLRNTKIKEEGEIEILQGFDMKQPSELLVSYTNIPNSSIKVSGQSRVINE